MDTIHEIHEDEHHLDTGPRLVATRDSEEDEADPQRQRKQRRPQDAYMQAVSNLEHLFTDYRNHIEDKLERYGDNLESNFVMLETFVHELLDQNALLIRSLGEMRTLNNSPSSSGPSVDNHHSETNPATLPKTLPPTTTTPDQQSSSDDEQFFLQHIRRLTDTFQEKISPAGQRATMEELERQNDELAAHVCDLQEENENLRHDLSNLVKMNKQKLSNSSHLTRSGGVMDSNTLVDQHSGAEGACGGVEGDDDEMFIFTEVNPEDIFGPIESIRESFEDELSPATPLPSGPSLTPVPTTSALLAEKDNHTFDNQLMAQRTLEVLSEQKVLDDLACDGGQEIQDASPPPPPTPFANEHQETVGRQKQDAVEDDDDDTKLNTHSSYESCDSLPPSLTSSMIRALDEIDPNMDPTGASPPRAKLVHHICTPPRTHRPLVSLSTESEHHRRPDGAGSRGESLPARGTLSHGSSHSPHSSSGTSFDIPPELSHLLVEKDLLIEQLQSHLETVCQELDDRDRLMYELECRYDEKRHQCDKLIKSVEAMEEFRAEISTLTDQKQELMSQLGALSDLYAAARSQLARTDYELKDARIEIHSQCTAIKILRDALVAQTSAAELGGGSCDAQSELEGSTSSTASAATPTTSAAVASPSASLV